MENDVKTKHANNETFNITLFGRTMTGKSTLMAILTHGNTDKIGHGGQRTTRDIRKYYWKGMQVTDVPGIEAYDGSEDDELASKAAKSADLVIFLITSGQPESAEADWLISLKKEDKPVVCLCNKKINLKSSMALKIALKRLPEKLEEMNIPGIRTQFNEFIKTELPDEDMEIFVVNLLAAQMSQQAEYAECRETLIKLSQFAGFERALIDQISQRAPFYRFRSYMALAGVPIYSHYLELGKTINSTFDNLQIINSKYKEFIKWKNMFEKKASGIIKDEISAVFKNINDDLSNFVDENVESSRLSEKWREYLEQYRLEEKTTHVLNDIAQRCENKINEFFQTLQKDFQFKSKFETINLGKNNIFNWKRLWGWGSAVTGVVGTAAVILLNSTPVGWIATAGIAIFTFFGFLSDSREKKLKDAKRKLDEKLRTNLNELENKFNVQVLQAFYKNIVNGIIHDAVTRFLTIKKTITTVFDTEIMAFNLYRNQHLAISNNLLKNILDRVEQKIIHP